MKLNEIKDLILKAKESNATTLDLSSKELTSLPPEIFELKNLTKLYLSSNQLTSLPPEISELKNLTTLYIPRNKLKNLPPEIFELKNLTTLSVSGNQLTFLPPEIFELKNLTKLYLYNNQLTSLPPEISELKYLKRLYVYNNQLTFLPPDISELKNLTEFSVSGNQLKEMPPKISELKNLTFLGMSRNQITYLPPKISELKSLTKLRVSKNQLTSFPSEILKLTALIKLYIHDNQLTSLPPEISELKNLTTLSVSGNQLTSLPPEIVELKNLTELWVNKNQLTSFPPEILKLTNLKELNIHDNQLKELPPEISELKNLTELSISGNQLMSLPSEIFELKNLTKLWVSENQLTSFPHDFFKLEILTELYIRDNQLTSIPPEISRLRNLTKLDVSGNQLISFPPEISELRNLTELWVNKNQLSSFPPEILKLTALIKLYIHDNQLTSLPPEISELKNLTKLDLSGNQLTSFPSEISDLKNLTILDLSGNQLTSLPPEFSKLKNLVGIDLSGNQLTFLSPEILKLKNLSYLNVSKIQLTSLPPEISKLKNLSYFDLSENQLTFLPPEISELRNLTKLDVSGNQLKEIPPEIAELKNLTTLFLSGNSLENLPLEIVKKGIEAIRNYFKSFEEEKRPLNEVKVLLVGEGGSGKTSLVKRLLGKGFDGNEHQTQGININAWKFKYKDKEIKVNFWDFGGQEIMHATHQIFLSKRSLYILVLDSRRDEKAEYWLKHIRSFGGDSPVLVVLNKIDENPSFELNRKFLQEKYPSIKGFFQVSCKNNRGIEVFSRKLKSELAKVNHLQITWAKSWFNVKTKLENMNCDFITYKQYLNMCLEEKVGNKSSQDTLVDFLNDLGVIVHFKDISLLDTHVLEPRWITEGIYKIINSETLVKRKGVLRFSLLDDILEQEKEGDYYYPPNRYNYIINLMKKFELCYAIDDETVLLPDLLAIPEPDFDFDFTGALKFFIEYDFLPRSVMPRFIVKMNIDIKDNLRWRTGVFLEDEKFNSSAVVRADIEAKRISIYVNGNQRRDYFAVILQRFQEINNSFEKLKAIEKIPLPDNPEISVSYDHLIKLESKGIETYMPDGSDNEYNVSDLLGTVNKRGERLLLEKIYRNTEMSKSREKEILEILLNLQKIDNGYDDEDTLIEKISSVVSVNLPLPGVELDLGKIVKLYLGWKRQQS